ncbi:hypothetical protein GGD66_005671 [Bradyrhizobium sp. CIR48]|uniref:AAA family ATPase n=1 Tax=Bradyrhizobium sp. CIR48 TaxID=2663840 RepID=UPI0016063D22|nr:AAA family ATPase [Bradyrhizobium sp. CIR48]MBB4427095.1 hypothetical protein [Bradyrhizobium sp. CIR48]
MMLKPSFDWSQIEEDIDLRIKAASGVEGHFTLFVTHDGVSGACQHFKTTDRAGLLAAIKTHETTPNLNIYLATSILRRKPPRGRGVKADIKAVPALVVDFDADTGKIGTMPVESSFEIETSPGNKQAFVLMSLPMTPEQAEPLAKALQIATGADSGTGDIAHVWRIAGTRNCPNAAKIKRGRDPEPCAVKFIKRFAGKTYSYDELRDALKPFTVESTHQGDDRFSSTVDVAPLVCRLSDIGRHLLKADGQPDRSAHAARVVEHFHFERFSLDEIVSLCLHEAGDWAKRYRSQRALIRDIERLWNKHAVPKNVERQQAAEAAQAFLRPRAANDNDLVDSIDAESLLAKHFEELRYVIPGYVVEGLTIIAGKPKLGKSWLAYDFAVAVATGGNAMGNVPCEQGDVLYLALEDNQRRAKSRIHTVAPSGRGNLRRLTMKFSAPLVDGGLLDDLDRWRTSSKNPRLIIIDVLAKVKPPQKRNQGIYSADYDAITPLQRYASEHRLAIVLITHTRKQEADDNLETVSGTNGLTGSADSVLVLTRNANGSVLYGRGRDIEEIETAMRFDAGKWAILGNADEVRKSNERRKIISVLTDARDELTPASIAKIAGMNSVNVRQLLRSMVRDGDISQPRSGYYSAIYRREAA